MGIFSAVIRSKHSYVLLRFNRGYRDLLLIYISRTENNKKVITTNLIVANRGKPTKKNITPIKSCTYGRDKYKKLKPRKSFVGNFVACFLSVITSVWLGAGKILIGYQGKKRSKIVAIFVAFRSKKRTNFRDIFVAETWQFFSYIRKRMRVHSHCNQLP